MRSISGMTPLVALELAEHIVADGFAARQDALSTLNQAATERDVNPVLIQVVSDDNEPRAARERALGRLVVQLSRQAA